MKKLLQTLSSYGFILLIALLGAIGGQGTKQVRRFIIPTIVIIYSYFILHNLWINDLWLLTISTMSGALSLGYGIPSFNGFNGTMDDEGSAIGGFFYKITKSELWANIFTRSIIGFLISLSMLSVPILKGTWFSFLIGTAIIIGIWGSVSWQNLGETKVKLFGKEYTLLNVDLLVYGVTAIGIVGIVG